MRFLLAAALLITLHCGASSATIDVPVNGSIDVTFNGIDTSAYVVGIPVEFTLTVSGGFSDPPAYPRLSLFRGQSTRD